MEILVNGAVIVQKTDCTWEVEAEHLKVTYGFDPQQAICVVACENTAADPVVSYVKKPYSILPVLSEKTAEGWQLTDAKVEETAYGGRAVAKLTMKVRCRSVCVKFHVVAFPGTSVIRQWFEIENESVARVERLKIRPMIFQLWVQESKDIYYAEYFGGGKPVHEAGGLNRKAFSKTYYEPYSLHLESRMTAEYVPLVLLTRDYGPRDGIMLAMDYVGPWSADIDRTDGYAADDLLTLAYEIDGGKKVQIEPQKVLQTPVITMAAYAGHRDNLMKTVFDWQYTYLWDYTNPDYYAKTRGPGRWVYSSRCLTEQFNYRTVMMNLEENLCQQSGFDIVWDDAGWSALPYYPEDAYSSVFQNNYEGPDYRPSQKYFRKCGLKWLLWFAGKPSIGIMENKEAAWGSFEWRTDDIIFQNAREERRFKEELKGYLEQNPKRSFHTCSLGGRYSHTFDIQRCSNYNYASDAGGGYYLNHYFSYFEVPDKWGDILATFGNRKLSYDGTQIWSTEPIPFETVKYSAEFSRRRLGMVPYPALLTKENEQQNRFDNNIYRYLKENGVAGRWSYTYHPKVYGDQEHYYLQRMSQDCQRGCVIVGHCPPEAATVFPRGLFAENLYEVSFQNRRETYTAAGKELMERGIALDAMGCGELIYLNLSDHPGVMCSGLVLAPRRAFVRTEQNIGRYGIGIYWIAAASRGISHYELTRNGELLAVVAVGTYWFDYSVGWDPDASYKVRAVGFNGCSSAWCKAERIEGEAYVASTLGYHGADMGEEGWYAEYSDDLKSFRDMRFIPPAECPLADLGGTPNQIGGIEGYWEGPGGARVGRGWQQSSHKAYCIRKYVAKHSGKAQLVSRATRDWYHQESGGTVKVCILYNDTVLMPWTQLKKDDLYGADFCRMIDLKASDCLRFVVSKSEQVQPKHYDPEAELVSWMPVISMTQERKPVKSIRVNCGSREAEVDEFGNVWSADEFCMEGRVQRFQNPKQTLMRSGRVGTCVKYEIPVADGLYAVKLRFEEPEAQYAGQRVMNIAIDGVLVNPCFDILEAGLFSSKQSEQVFWNVLPDRDGKIHIAISALSGEALLQAVEIAPQQSEVIRINCGSDRPFVDWMGNIWQADSQYDNSCLQEKQTSVIQASPTLYDQGLYQTAKTGREIRYQIPVRDGLYSVHLKFAELWLPENEPRPVEIAVNGKVVRRGWDARKAAGYRNMAADLRFDDISPVNGSITVTVRAKGEHPAILQAIELDTET